MALLGLSVVLFAGFFALVASGQRGGETLADNLWLSGTALPAAGLAIGAGITGAFAAIRDRDRSPGVIAAVLVGALVLVFVIGEVVSPH